MILHIPGGVKTEKKLQDDHLVFTQNKTKQKRNIQFIWLTVKNVVHIRLVRKQFSHPRPPKKNQKKKWQHTDMIL